MKKSKRQLIIEFLYRSEKFMVEDRFCYIKQNSSDRYRVLEEFNKLFDDFIEKSSDVQDLEHFKIFETEKIAFNNIVTAESGACTEKSQGQYTHNQLDQRVTTVSQLKGPGKEEFLEKALDFACKIQYGDLRAKTLALLLPILEGPKNEEFMEKALELVSGLISEYQRIKSLSLRLPYMDEQRKEEIIEQALELAFNLKDNGMKARAFLLIIPHMDESRQKGISERAVYFKHEVQSEYLRRGAAALLRRVETLSSLAPYIGFSAPIAR